MVLQGTRFVANGPGEAVEIQLEQNPPEAFQQLQKIDAKIHQFVNALLDRFLEPKSTQNRQQINQKTIKKKVEKKYEF